MAKQPTKKAHQFKGGERIPASWAQKVENFISSFSVLSGGQFIFDGRNAALQIYGGSTFSGVMLGGVVWLVSLPDPNPNGYTLITGTRSTATHLKIDYRLRTVSWTDTTPETRYVHYLPVAYLSGFIYQPFIPHYVTP